MSPGLRQEFIEQRLSAVVRNHLFYFGMRMNTKPTSATMQTAIFISRPIFAKNFQAST
jgi:hypothetical protein